MRGGQVLAMKEGGNQRRPWNACCWNLVRLNGEFNRVNSYYSRLVGWLVSFTLTPRKNSDMQATTIIYLSVRTCVITPL